MLWTWIITSFPADTTHRAVALSFINMVSYWAGDLPGSFVYPSKWGPDYRRSHIITLIALFLTVAFVLLVVRVPSPGAS